MACSRHPGGGAPDGGDSQVENALYPSAHVIEGAACMSRGNCVFEDMVHTGAASDGDQLVVATVRLAPEPGKPSCDPRETWLLRSGPSGIRRVQLIASHCTSQSMARPEVTFIRPNTVRYVASDEGRKGATKFVADTLDIALEPFQLLRKEVRAWSTDTYEACNGHDGYWDWVAFRGEDSLFGTRGSRCAPSTSQDIPHVELADEEAFLKSGWRTTSLGDCSMRAGGQSASLRVLSVGNESLFIEVTDDHFVPSGAVADRLVLRWPSDTEGPKTMHVGVTGHADWPFDVLMATADATTRRYRIKMYKPQIRITYEDSDDGKTIRESVSSASEGGLSTVSWVNADSAVCTERHGSLQVDRKVVVRSPTEPLYRD
jgi:hypothetical protein